jgi:hypothetical protein
MIGLRYLTLHPVALLHCFDLISLGRLCKRAPRTGGSEDPRTRDGDDNRVSVQGAARRTINYGDATMANEVTIIGAAASSCFAGLGSGSITR